MEGLVYETIRSLLAEQLGYEEERITMQTVILEDLEAEREDLEELMLSLEQELAITWSEDDLKDLTTIGDLVAFIENQI